MGTLIFRACAPLIVGLMLVFSVFVLLRGHNEPGGGFIAGLIAGAAMAALGIAFGTDAVRRTLRLHPMAIAGCGLLLAATSGVPSLFLGKPFMTGLWFEADLFGSHLALSTVLLFDLGVFLIVAGTFTSIALSLEEEGE